MTDRQLGKEWWHQEAAGGGSLLDYCCYGTILSNWYLGEKPQGVYGLKANFNHRFGDAEDYASLMVRYPEAVSILEGTWNTISSGYPSGPIVWGEKGALIVENGGDHGIHANVCVYLDRYSTTPSMYAVPFQKQPRVRIIVRRIGEPQLRDPLFIPAHRPFLLPLK